MIKEIVIISGKGGTGKTSIAGSLACLVKNKIIVDCDVDAADLHLILGGRTIFSEDFIGRKKSEIVPDKCTGCGICSEYCRFDAIKEKTDTSTNITKFYIDEISCEGCGVCTKFCFDEAIRLKDHVSGHWFISETKYGPLVRAKLGIAEANSGKLVSLLRQAAQNQAKMKNSEMILIDGSPGIGCPVIASLTGVSYAIIVTEPTVSALHDMKRLYELAQHFSVKTGICINKYDLNLKLCDAIEQFSESKRMKVLSKIPYDIDMVKAQIEGVPYLEYTNGRLSKSIYRLWENLGLDIIEPDRGVKGENKDLIQLDKHIN